jgi:hypothetical protein
MLVWPQEPNETVPRQNSGASSFLCGTSIETGLPVYIKPSINADVNYPSFMYVNSSQSIVPSSDIKVSNEFLDLDHAKVLAIERWDRAEVTRLTHYNLELAVFWVRKILLRQYLQRTGQGDQARAVVLHLDKGRFQRIHTMH